MHAATNCGQTAKPTRNKCAYNKNQNQNGKHIENTNRMHITVHDGQTARAIKKQCTCHWKQNEQKKNIQQLMVA